MAASTPGRARENPRPRCRRGPGSGLRASPTATSGSTGSSGSEVWDMGPSRALGKQDASPGSSEGGGIGKTPDGSREGEQKPHHHAGHQVTNPFHQADEAVASAPDSWLQQ